MAVWAEERGFDDAWIGEERYPDAFVACAVAAVQTSHIRLGSAIVPLRTRTAATLAIASSSVCELAPGRFVLGLGVSTEGIVMRWHGVPYRAPMEGARETIAALRQMFSGEKTSFAGSQVASEGFRLKMFAAPPPLMLAALNPRMLELAGQIADGVWLNFVPVDHMRQTLHHVQDGVSHAPSVSEMEIMISIPCCVTDDPAKARAEFRRQLIPYFSSAAYRKAFIWHGFEQEVSRAEEAWRSQDTSALRTAVSDRLIDAIGAFGSARYCRERVEAYSRLGATTVSIAPYGTDPLATLAAFAR